MTVISWQVNVTVSDSNTGQRNGTGNPKPWEPAIFESRETRSRCSTLEGRDPGGRVRNEVLDPKSHTLKKPDFNYPTYLTKLEPVMKRTSHRNSLLALNRQWSP